MGRCREPGIADPFDLSAALLRRLAVEGEQPAFIYRRDGWRWRSWRWWLERATAVAAALRGEAAGAVSWPFEASPVDYAVDLGVQIAGRDSIPDLELPPAGTLLLELPGRAPRAGARCLAIDPSTLPAAALTGEALGGAWVRRRGRWQRLTADELGAAIAELPAAADSPGRPIVLAGFGLDRLAGRAIAGWAVESRGALVLEARRDRLAEAIFWARPTIVALPAVVLGEVAETLSAWADRRSLRRRLARQLRRLTEVWTDGEEAVAPLWEELGVDVQRLPFQSADRAGQET